MKGSTPIASLRNKSDDPCNCNIRESLIDFLPLIICGVTLGCHCCLLYSLIRGYRPPYPSRIRCSLYSTESYLSLRLFTDKGWICTFKISNHGLLGVYAS